MKKQPPKGKKGAGIRALKRKPLKSLKLWAINEAAKQKGENNGKTWTIRKHTR